MSNAHAALKDKPERETNDKRLNLEKTTSSVLSVLLLIYDLNTDIINVLIMVDVL